MIQNNVAMQVQTDLYLLARDSEDLSEAEVLQRGHQLEMIVLSMGDGDSLSEAFLNDPVLQSRLTDLYCRYETCLEHRYARSVLAGQSSEYLLSNRFETLMQEESDLARISSGERVLFIGSGPYPVSAFALTQFVDCVVDCCEHDRDRARLSEKVIEALGGRMAVKVASGEEVDARGYDVAIIALLAHPKYEILKNLGRCGIRRIVCRTSHGARRLLYKTFCTKPPPPLEIVDHRIATGDQTISSLLVSQREQRS